ncbi:OLC1v1020000C2 [Oldenlandia corymbosa var. corymbosa]|nr:OLC1v1020000C2 [Oldenlandia corymbosa var. corymbosa]
MDSLLKSAKSFLSHRNFEECRKYATKALEINPKHPGPAQLLAIAAILSVCPPSPTQTQLSDPDWYSVLNLPRFSRDLNAIRSNFGLLYGIVNPEQNPNPFAAEAREWVLKAGEVLGDPDSKAQFDRDLRTRTEDSGKGSGGTFWTVCPYCYFMYEYENGFLDCAIRCSNPNCRRPFAAAAVAASAAPRPEVVERGKYACAGFIPLRTNHKETDEDQGWKWWDAFASMGSDSGSVSDTGLIDRKRQGAGLKRKARKSHVVIDLSDDGDDGEKGGEEIKKIGHVNEMVRKKKKKKQAAMGKKKVMGKGIRPKWNHPGLVEGKEIVEGSGLQFCAGEDDIFVSLDTDLGFGALGDW